MINNVVLVGRLTKDSDLRYTSSGSAVASFTLAVNRNFTNQNGNREADFINCVIWRKPAETMANYSKKGTLLGVVGRIQTRSYENQQGQRVYVTEVVCENFQLLESKGSFNSQNDYPDNNNSNQGSFPNQQQASNPFDGGGSTIDIDSDNLPF